jgi:hypothetical protein
MNLMAQQVACDNRRESQRLFLQATERGGQEEIKFLPTRFEQQERWVNTNMLVWLILMMVVLIGIGILRLRLKRSERKHRKKKRGEYSMSIGTIPFGDDSSDGTNSCEQVSSH